MDRGQWRHHHYDVQRDDEIGGTHQPARGGQHQCFFNYRHRNAELIELRRQQPVGTAKGSHRAGRLPVRLQHLANIFFLAAVVTHHRAAHPDLPAVH